ncbi:MAG: hypothetical protein AABY75_02385 [Bacteroidota bacterium]
MSRQPAALYKTAGSPQYAVLNINNITSWMRYDGQSNHSPGADDGAYYPRGTGSVIYQDGLVWGGKAFLDAAHTVPGPRQLIRVGGGTYGIGTRAGRILNPFLGPAVGTGVEDPNAADVRVFRIRRDYDSMSEVDYTRDAASVNEISESSVTPSQIATVRAQYAADWTSWPVAKGAPFIDRNGNGIFDPPPPFSPMFSVDSLVSGGYDEPGVSGADMSLPADQVIFTVYNDLNVDKALYFASSEPMGLEVQKTMWGYRRTDASGNLYFVRFRLIYKGGVDTSVATGDHFGTFWIDSMYVAQWSDPDLGNAGDDLVGCDTTLGLGFCYNANAEDGEFQSFSLAPPAVGYDLLAGARVASPGDSAMFGFIRRAGWKNLPMTAFVYSSYGSPQEPYPPYYPITTGRWWKMLRGFQPLGSLTTADQYYASPPGVAPSKFTLSGDPVAGTGWLDGMGQSYSFPAGDRRIVLSSGPFAFAPGDTQEIYMSLVAGLGGDRISSVAVMKYNDRYVQSAFDRLFAIPRAPAKPDVKTVALDREIVLEWGSNAVAVQRTEAVTSAGLQFEGYNIYELPTSSSAITEGTKLATYDLANGVTKIVDETWSATAGTIIPFIVQRGNDTGVRRSIRITRSYMTDPTSGDPLVNGKEYHFAVTAYSWNSRSGDLPVSLECEPVIVSVRPRIPFGEAPLAGVGDTLEARQVAGTADTKVVPLVVDPLAGRGDTFRVSFQLVGTTSSWNLSNVSGGPVVASGQTNLSGDESYPIVDGVLIKVVGPVGYGLKPGAWGLGDGTSFNQGARSMSWANGDGLHLEEFNGAAGWTAPVYLYGSSPARPVPITELKKIVIQFVRHGTASGADFSQATDDTASYAYRFLRDAALPPAQPSFGAWIVNPATGWRIQDYRISMPLAVYDIDANPPQRLAVAYSENNATNGLVDGYYWPGNQAAMPGGSNNTDANGPREWLFVLNSAYDGPNPNTGWQDILDDPSIPVMYTFTWNRRNANAWNPPLEVQFTPVRTPINDVFEFVIPAPRRTQVEVDAGYQRIGVYPNPYLASREQVSSALEQSVTFTNLPQRAIFRIFNLAGHLVRTLHKDHPSQFFNWDLKNENGWLVASGMYICLVELPDLGRSKVLKLGVVMGDRIPRPGE